jgi:hypothetical protein
MFDAISARIFREERTSKDKDQSKPDIPVYQNGDVNFATILCCVIQRKQTHHNPNCIRRCYVKQQLIVQTHEIRQPHQSFQKTKGWCEETSNFPSEVALPPTANPAFILLFAIQFRLVQWWDGWHTTGRIIAVVWFIPLQGNFQESGRRRDLTYSGRLGTISE